VNVQLVGDDLDVAVAGGRDIIKELLAGPPLTGVSPDVHRIGPFRQQRPQPFRVASVLRIDHLADGRADSLRFSSPHAGHPLRCMPAVSPLPPATGNRQTGTVQAGPASGYPNTPLALRTQRGTRAVPPIWTFGGRDRPTAAVYISVIRITGVRAPCPLGQMVLVARASLDLVAGHRE
jgi:hypothetical protein